MMSTLLDRSKAMSEEKHKKNWIKAATKNKGALHEKLGVAKDEKIPAEKMKKAEHSKDPETRKEAVLAETLKGLHHKKPKALQTSLYGKKKG